MRGTEPIVGLRVYSANAGNTMTRKQMAAGERGWKRVSDSAGQSANDTNQQ